MSYPHSAEHEVRGAIIRSVTYSEQRGCLPLVMLNGISCPPDTWGTLPQHISGTVIAIGIPGPEHMPEAPLMSDYARIVLSAIRRIAGDRFNLAAFSWGGLLAQQLLLEGAKPGKLILAATLPATTGAAWDIVSQSKRAADIVRSPERTLEAAAELYGGDIRVNPELAVTLGLAREIDPEHHKRQLHAAEHLETLIGWTTLRALFLRLQPDTLVIAGSDDPLIPHASARSGAIQLGARLETIEGGGHGFLLTRPEESAAIINRFVAA